MAAAESRRVADDLLEQFHLTKWGPAPEFALSGGMAQRLMVARSIFHRPAVLFMDEPTAGLDPQSRLALWEILGELLRLGQTILLTTHYMEEADQLCNRVAIMDHGKILALDTPGGLKRSVGADTIVTVKTSGDPASLAEHISSVVDGVGRTRLIQGGVELHFTGAERIVPRVVESGRERWLRSRRSRCGRADARDGVHQLDRQGAARMTEPSTVSWPAAVPAQWPIALEPDALRRRREPHRAARLDPARPSRAAQELRRVRRAHANPAVPAGVRVPIRVPEASARASAPAPAPVRWRSPISQPGCVRRGCDSRSCSRESRPSPCRCRLSSAYARDRGPRPSPMPDLAGGDRKGALGRRAGRAPAVIVFPIAAVIHAPGVHAGTSTSTGPLC